MGRIRNPEAVAWTIAAEGCITIGINKARKNHHYYPVIEVVNTEKGFIDEFWELTDFYGTAKYKGVRRDGKRRTIAESLAFLSEIYQFLPIKKEQAEIVIEFCKTKLSGIASDEPLTSMVSRIRKLNKRGVDI